jgi:hypothetical protein
MTYNPDIKFLNESKGYSNRTWKKMEDIWFRELKCSQIINLTISYSSACHLYYAESIMWITL